MKISGKPIHKISLKVVVLNKSEISEIKGGGRDHGDNGGVPPDNDK